MVFKMNLDDDIFNEIDKTSKKEVKNDTDKLFEKDKKEVEEVDMSWLDDVLDIMNEDTNTEELDDIDIETISDTKIKEKVLEQPSVENNEVNFIWNWEEKKSDKKTFTVVIWAIILIVMALFVWFLQMWGNKDTNKNNEDIPSIETISSDAELLEETKLDLIKKEITNFIKIENEYLKNNWIKIVDLSEKKALWNFEDKNISIYSMRVAYDIPTKDDNYNSNWDQVAKFDVESLKWSTNIDEFLWKEKEYKMWVLQKYIANQNKLGLFKYTANEIIFIVIKDWNSYTIKSIWEYIEDTYAWLDYKDNTWKAMLLAIWKYYQYGINFKENSATKINKIIDKVVNEYSSDKTLNNLLKYLMVNNIW